MTKRRMTFLAGGLCAGLALTAATARAGGVNMDKINRGAWLVPTMPGQAHGAKVASPGRRSPRRTSTLELQLGPAGQPATSTPALGARPPLMQATAGQPLRLQLRITNHGPAGDVRLRAFTSAFSVSLPAVVPVDAGASMVITLTAESKGCRGLGFVEISAAQGGPAEGVASTSTRLPIRCR